MEIEEIRSYAPTMDYTEKLYHLFAKKMLLVTGTDLAMDVSYKGLERWINYLDRFANNVEHIRKFAVPGDVVDYLIGAINENGGRVVIRDPANRQNFILINKDFAEKVMALGGLP